MRATVAFLLAVVGYAAATTTPIIGILTAGPDGGWCDTVSAGLGPLSAEVLAEIAERRVDGDPSNDNGCFQSAYVKWIESGGGRVVPIPYTSTTDELDFLFESLNGIFFTGGDLSLDPATQYYQSGNYLFQKVLAANDAGDYFPMWGTCMGFQFLNILAAQNNSVLSSGVFASENISLALDFTSQAPASRLYGSAPPSIYHTLQTENCTVNYHHDGVEPHIFKSNPALFNFYNLLSTNRDLKGLEFVSSVEAKNYPIYGVQYHPERIQFEFPGPTAIDHSPSSILVAQYHANFLVNEAKKNNHHFPADVEDSYLIYHYTPVYLGFSEQGYYF